MTGTRLEPRPAPRATSVAELARDNRVVQAALVMTAVQLGFRGWVSYGSWFRYDDLGFVSRMTNEGPGLGTAIGQYGGHVMPVGMWLTWLANVVAPWEYWPIATMLLLGQLLADVGCLVLLLRLFGPRRGILPPLALYLFSAISIPSVLWWASGANQLPLQAALFWALSAHVAYLRSGPGPARARDGGVAGRRAGLLREDPPGAGSDRRSCRCRTSPPAAWSQAGLRSGAATGPGICLYTAWAWPTCCSTCASGSPSTRAGPAAPGWTTWSRTWWSRPGSRASWAVPCAGRSPARAPSRDPGPGVLLALVVVGLVVRELARTRRRSLRAWWLVVFFLGCDLELVLAGRASFVGPMISLDYRYQAELPAVTAVALACASMPILGAVEPVEVTGSSRVVDAPVRVVALDRRREPARHRLGETAGLDWHRTNDAKPYFGTPLRRPGAHRAGPSRSSTPRHRRT